MAKGGVLEEMDRGIYIIYVEQQRMIKSIGKELRRTAIAIATQSPVRKSTKANAEDRRHTISKYTKSSHPRPLFTFCVHISTTSPFV